VDWEDAAWQVLRALRRHRSQKELSRLLGYRSNVVSNWEARRRFPTGEGALEICEKVGVDVLAALATFTPECAAHFHRGGLAQWLQHFGVAGQLQCWQACEWRDAQRCSTRWRIRRSVV
jgi:transcriptional regulator with XRE-family HTH domain